MVASHSTVPSIERLEPYPALVISLSSRIRNEASIASVAVAPARRNFMPISAALTCISLDSGDGHAGNLRNACLQMNMFVLVAMEPCSGMNENGRYTLWFLSETQHPFQSTVSAVWEWFHHNGGGLVIVTVVHPSWTIMRWEGMRAGIDI